MSKNYSFKPSYGPRNMTTSEALEDLMVNHHAKTQPFEATNDFLTDLYSIYSFSKIHGRYRDHYTLTTPFETSRGLFGCVSNLTEPSDAPEVLVKDKDT